MAEKTFNPVTHVIFDLDGLLLATETLYFEAINAIAHRYGKEYTNEVRVKVMGKIGHDAAQTVIDELQLPLTVEEYINQVQPINEKAFATVDLMPGALRLIQHLSKHQVPMAIATSSAQKNFEIKTKSHQEIFNSGKYFHHILIASSDPEVQHGKPHPQTFLVCAKRFDPPASPERVLVFEDSSNGVKAAIAAGMQCIQVPDPAIAKLIDCSPTLVIESLNDFKPELFGLPPF